MRAAAAALAVICLCGPSRALAAEDPWFGRDKLLHFVVSFGLASAGYAACTAVSQERWTPFACGAGLALGAGLVKEGLDLAGNGDASWRDLVWDVAGTAGGLLTAWAADRLIFNSRSSGSDGRPAAAAAQADPFVRQRVHDLVELRRVLFAREL